MLCPATYSTVPHSASASSGLITKITKTESKTKVTHSKEVKVYAIAE